MKMIHTFKQMMLITLFSIGTASWSGAQQPAKQPGVQPQPGQREQTPNQPNQDRLNRDRFDQNRQQDSRAHQPRSVNRASSLVGMEVKNQTSERLGRIKDVVFDLDSGQISYFVLTTDQGEKMHAVPARAFQASPDGSSIVLNADKSKLTRAEGFDRNNWPSMTNPSWGAEPFWEGTSDQDRQGQFRDQNRNRYQVPNKDPNKSLEKEPNKPGQQTPPSTQPK